MATEETLVLIKPDGVARSLVGTYSTWFDQLLKESA